MMDLTSTDARESPSGTARTEAALSDQEVVARVISGETALYGILVRRHRRRLYRLLRRILGDHDEIEDVMQEAHCRAIRYLNHFEGRSSFLKWLSRVMINEAYTYLRRRRQHQLLDEVLDSREGQTRQFASPASNPEQQAIGRELEKIVGAAVDSLPELYRVVFKTREIEQASIADTAARLGVTEQCVKSRALRARQLLQRKIPCGARAYVFADPSV